MTYKQYLKTDKWQELKRNVFKRSLRNAAGYNPFGVCENCGYSPYKPCLQVHHKTYERLFCEELEDLILLCPRCHKEIHEGGDK